MGILKTIKKKIMKEEIEEVPEVVSTPEVDNSVECHHCDGKGTVNGGYKLCEGCNGMARVNI